MVIHRDILMNEINDMGGRNTTTSLLTLIVSPVFDVIYKKTTFVLVQEKHRTDGPND